jgi:peroxiredoxin
MMSSSTMIYYSRLRTLTLTGAIVTVATAFPPGGWAQQSARVDSGKASTEPDSVAAIDGLYRKELDDIERRRLERLAALAGRQSGNEANQTYALYFRAAIAANLFAEAGPVAERVLRSKETSSTVTLLADVVKIMSEVGRGAYEQSLESLTSAIEDRARTAAGGAVKHDLPLTGRITLLEAYFQRLEQAGQFDVAKKAFALVRDRATDPAVKAFASSRLARLELIGKPAPPIAGVDVDGRTVRLADFHGNVVLVVFWASWCLPNAEEVAQLETVYAAYRDRGLRILGINLDALQEGGKSPDAVRLAVRRFLLEHNVAWPNLINGSGEQDHARSYAVTEIPANVLIGRDGNVIHIDLARSNLEKVVARAVGR